MNQNHNTHTNQTHKHKPKHTEYTNTLVHTLQRTERNKWNQNYIIIFFFGEKQKLFSF